jgi:inorganic pyrophosphatase
LEGKRNRVVAVVVTVDLKKKDSEIKILLDCTREEIEMALRWHNGGLQSGILVGRDDVGSGS